MKTSSRHPAARIGLAVLVAAGIGGAPLSGFQSSPFHDPILAHARGVLILDSPSSFTAKTGADKIMDGKPRVFWRSSRRARFPQVFLFQLPEPGKINRLFFYNAPLEFQNPGISAKDVRVEYSMEGPTSGFRTIGEFALEKTEEIQGFGFPTVKARWIRLSILSNYGHPEWTELGEFEVWYHFNIRYIPLFLISLAVVAVALILTSLSFKLASGSRLA